MAMLMPKDLLQLKKSLSVLPDIKKILKQIDFYRPLNTLDNVYELLEKSIYEKSSHDHQRRIFNQGRL